MSMGSLAYLSRLWNNLTHRRKVERELDQEMSAYLSLLAEESSPREARLTAGGIEQLKEQVREVKAGFFMQTILQDVRYGWRMLRRSPTFTVVAILALALGIGATTTIFSIVYGVLLRPLPYPADERIAMVFNHFSPQNTDHGTLSLADYLDWKKGNHAFESAELFRTAVFDVTGAKEPEQVQGVSSTAGFFSTLRVQPLMGRIFLPGEDAANADGVVVVSENWWRSSLGGDPGILGKKLNLNGVPSTVIGVMPSSFHFPRPPYKLWTNLRLIPPKRRGPFGWRGLARLKPGVTLAQAQMETNGVGQRIQQENPQTYQRMTMPVVPLRDELIGNVRTALLAFLGAVLVLLAIAAVNVACLLLARATAREKEIALRVSLGAGSGRLIRQLLTESLLLSILGGVAGCVLAYLGIAALRAWNPGNLPRIEDVRLDGVALGFALLVSAVTGVLFGVAPAFQSGRDRLASSLREGGRGGTARAGRRRLQAVLVMGELALALILVTSAGLLVRSFVLLGQVRSGSQAPPENVLSMKISPIPSKYRTSEQIIPFYSRVLERAKATPGVVYAGISDSLPPDRQYDYDTFVIQGQQLAPGETNPAVTCPIVSADYFRALGIPLVRGRFFTEHDNGDAPAVVIISESLARRYFPNDNPIGRRLKASGPDLHDTPFMEIVGVVGGVRYTGLDSDPADAYYQPYAQTLYYQRTNLVVRANGPAASLATSLRREIRELDADTVVSDVVTMDEALGASIVGPKFRTLLVGGFALCALLLAAIGIYGVIAYSVAQRTQEIGIRMALGAQRSKVIGQVVAQGVRLALAGTVVGIAGALFATRLLASLLFAVKATDVLTFAVGPLILIAVASLASFLPACRAAMVDPVIALRHE
jgi:putative ABC transport system permease protein